MTSWNESLLLYYHVLVAQETRLRDRKRFVGQHKVLVNKLENKLYLYCVQ